MADLDQMFARLDLLDTPDVSEEIECEGTSRVREPCTICVQRCSKQHTVGSRSKVLEHVADPPRTGHGLLMCR